MQSKVGQQISGYMYIEIGVGGEKLQATVHTRVDTMYMANELVDEISLPYKKEKGESRHIFPC